GASSLALFRLDYVLPSASTLCSTLRRLVRRFRPGREERCDVRKGDHSWRIYPFDNLRVCISFCPPIIRPPYIIGWLFVVNTFSAIAGYFLLSRAITSNANFSDIVCGVLILCSELISTNLSICAFLLLK